ncbi:MAG: hypothetical protein IKQ93_09520 [Candidatus Methanomethylophilaceae archaeon]|nr:hypothetical protein [Candidatus Methanomethylophilaceae archaeon]
MDKRMKATFAVVLALAFVLSFAMISTDSNNDVSGADNATVIDKDQVYHDGDVFELTTDYIIKSNVTLTFEAGSTLHIDAIMPWSITGETGSKFVFNEGAEVLFTAMGFFEKVNVLDAPTSVAIDGKVTYGYSGSDSKLTATFTVDNGTKAVVDGLTYNFKATSVSLAPEFKTVEGELTEVKGDVKIKSDGVTLAFGDIAIGSIDKVDISVYVSYAAGDSDYTVTLKGDAAVKAAFMGIVVEISEEMDLTAGLTGITGDIDWSDLNSLKDIIPYIKGSMNGELKFNSNGEDTKIENAVAQYSADFSDKEVKVDFGFDVDLISVNYGGVEGYVKNISISDELTVELGSFMKLLSARNIIGSYIFVNGYDEEIGKEAIKEFMIDFLTPAFPDGFNVEQFVNEAVEKIPAEQLYADGIFFAYSLYFIETVDGLDFAKICLDSYNSTTQTGIVSKHLEYIELVANEIMKSITGMDDYEPTEIEGFGTFSVGQITAEAEKGYNFGFNGLAFTLTFKDGVEAEGSFGSIQAKADSKEVYADFVTPAMSAKCSVDEDGIKAECTVEGDLTFTIQDKSNDAQFTDMSYAFKGINVKETIDLNPKVAKISTSESVKGIDIAMGDVVVTIGAISDSANVELDSGSVLDIFSMRNLDNLVEFILTGYNPEMSESSFKQVLMDVYATAYPSEQTEAIIDSIVENTPEEIIPVIGFECQFIYFTFEKENLILKNVCADIAKNVKDLDSPEGMIEYVSKAVEKIFEVETGIKDFQMPSVTAEYHQDIGKITVAYDDETLTFNGQAANFELKNGTVTANYTFRGLDFNYVSKNIDVEIVLPSVYITMNDTDGLYGECSVSGDFVYSYVDPQDLYSSYILCLYDIDSGDSFALRNGNLELTTGFDVGEIYGYFGEKESDEQAAFMVDGANLIVKGNVDLATLVEAFIAGDYTSIVADLEISGSVGGLMYSQMLGEDTHTGTYKAAVDGLDVNIKVSNGEKGISFNGKIALDDGYKSDSSSMMALSNTEFNFSYAENKGTMDYTGDVNITEYSMGEAREMLIASNLDLKGDIVPSEMGLISIIPTAASADVEIWNHGITTDLGKVTMTGDFSKGEYQFETDRAEISGNYTGVGDLKSMSGYINGITVIPSNDSELMIKYTDAEIEYVTKDGNKLLTTLTPNDSTKIVDITCATSGDGNGVILESTIIPRNLVIYDILESAYYNEYVDSITITGNVPLVAGKTVDLENTNVKGKLYFRYGELILKSGEKIDFNLTGAIMCYDTESVGGTGFSIAAMPGYTLSGKYSGFEVNSANNMVTKIDFDEYGVATCSTESVGNQYNVIINGEKFTAYYGAIFTFKYTGGNEPLWFVDEDGNIRGVVAGGALQFYYDVVGDITLTPVFGTKAATGQPGSIVKVDDDAFFVQGAAEPFFVENKSGVRFVIEDNLLGLPSKFSATQTKYDGMKAYEIKGNTDTWIAVPIDSVDAFVYHIVNGVEVPMETEIYYDLDNDQCYATFHASSYSIYAIDEFNHDGGSSENNVMIYVIIVVAVLVVIAIAAVMVSKKKQNA